MTTDATISAIISVVVFALALIVFDYKDDAEILGLAAGFVGGRVLIMMALMAGDRQ